MGSSKVVDSVFAGHQYTATAGGPDPLGVFLSGRYVALSDEALEASTSAATFGAALTQTVSLLLDVPSAIGPVAGVGWSPIYEDYQVGFLCGDFSAPTSVPAASFSAAKTVARVAGQALGTILVATFEDEAWKPTTAEQRALNRRWGHRRASERLHLRRACMMAARLLDAYCYVPRLDEILADPTMQDDRAVRGYVSPGSRIRFAQNLAPAQVALPVWWQARMREGHSRASAQTMLSLILPSHVAARLTYTPDGIPHLA